MAPQGKLGAGARRATARRGAVTRQRQVVTVLVGTLAVCVGIALATGASAAWWVVVALLPLVCAYMAVLARSRRIAAEREISYAFFGHASAERPTANGFEELFAAERERAVAGR